MNIVSQIPNTLVFTILYVKIPLSKQPNKNEWQLVYIKSI